MIDKYTGTILWHDYETFGVNPKVDFPVQFAAIRTTLDLEVIENQVTINWLCKMPIDYLPHPKACLVTGITPIYSQNKGMSEPEFAQKIYQQMSQAGTCVAGYNSMRFDEEVTRHLFFRNMFPVYEREYKNDNSRWDVIDLVRACYALRPQGVNWPVYDSGFPCFKLDTLTTANEIEHSNAHDALADVRATIAIAKLIKHQQPKLYDYYWQLRNKHVVNNMLQQFQSNIFVYISSFISSAQGCCTIVMPVCAHPTNNNAVLCIDLHKAVTLFEQNDVTKLQEALFTKTQSSYNAADAAALNNEKDESPAIYAIAVNKCPFVAPIKTLDKTRAQQLGININLAIGNYKRLCGLSFLPELCKNLYAMRPSLQIPENIDEQLYTSEFPSNADSKLMVEVRQALPEQLSAYKNRFESELLNKLLLRYRARNYPNLLDEDEIQYWQQHVHRRLTQNNKSSCLSLQEFAHCIDELSKEYQQHPEKLKVLSSLQRYAQQLTLM